MRRADRPTRACKRRQPAHDAAGLIIGNRSTGRHPLSSGFHAPLTNLICTGYPRYRLQKLISVFPPPVRTPTRP